jgi:spore coat polysaccharide biosynthesis predicted glycosyltransferase SpsG
MHALAKELTKLLDKYDFFFLCFLHVIIICIFLTKSKKSIVDRKVKEDSNLDIFEMTTNTSEPTMKLINKELLIFKRYQVNVENIKSPPQWWEK